MTQLSKVGIPGGPIVLVTQIVVLGRRPEIELVQAVGVGLGDTHNRHRRGFALVGVVVGSEEVTHMKMIICF